MAFRLPPMTIDTTTSTGTGDLQLGGAPAGTSFRGLAATMQDGDTTKVKIEDDADPTNWEISEVSFNDGSPDSISRLRVLASSSGGGLINFGAGTKEIRVGLTDEEVVGSAAYTLINSSEGSSSVASLDFLGSDWGFNRGFEFIDISMFIIPATADVTIQARLSTDGVGFDSGSNYTDGDMSDEVITTSQTEWDLKTTVGNSGIQHMRGVMRLLNVDEDSFAMMGYFFDAGLASTNAFTINNRWIRYQTADDIEGIRLFASSGNIATWDLRFYGVLRQ